MIRKPKLPELEATLGELVLDLLRAPRLYPEMVCSAPVDSRGEVSPDAVRVTQHYVAGLLAYGFGVADSDLQDATMWFATEFPNAYRSRVDSVEMTRLEALLLLDAPEDDILPRLEQLARQRTVDGDHFVIEGRGSDFDTLWSLKVMLLARQRNILNNLVDLEQLRRLSGRIITTSHLDKDVALALRLRYELAGRLRRTQLQTLQRLLHVAERTGGMWGLDRDMLWVTDALRSQNLTAGDFASQREVLREMILSTCYVIENLMPLLPDHPEVEAPVRDAMTLWWGIFQGRNAVTTLHALFPSPYDYLLILARTLVAVRAYLGQPLIQWGSSYVYHLQAGQELPQVANPDRASILQTLRNWLRLDLVGDLERLHLGMSDSDIVRIRPRVWNPMVPEEAGYVTVPYADSLVVKFGPADEINRERANYSQLPNSIRRCFAHIPESSYIDSRGRAFLVLQDLLHYRTLVEMLRQVPQARESINREIGPFLLWMHQGQGRAAGQASDGPVWELYLLPMQRHIGRIFSYIQDNGLLDRRKLEEAHILKQTLLGLIGDLVRYQIKLEGFPVAYMHGDLHSRNIMVYRRRANERGTDDAELDFKLIDLEKFRLDGDAALDAGQLLADLWLVASSLKSANDRRPLENLSAVIEDAYAGFAAERGDTTFSIRRQLAQARALIRVAKGRTKVGAAALQESRRAPAITVAHEVLGYAREAATHLEAVAAALRDTPLR